MKAIISSSSGDRLNGGELDYDVYLDDEEDGVALADLIKDMRSDFDLDADAANPAQDEDSLKGSRGFDDDDPGPAEGSNNLRGLGAKLLIEYDSPNDS
jgi:hypothetical protein